MSPVTAPQAPGRLGTPVAPQPMLAYLGALDAWMLARRSELAALDAEVLARRRQDLTADLALSMALWQAVKNRYDLLMVTWDSGRVGPPEADRLSSLIWGRLDTGGQADTQLGNLAVSLPEACRLSDALVAQLRTRLNLDPAIEQQAARLRDLRAQLERIRDQLRLEPPPAQDAAQAQLAQFAARVDEIADKHGRGGDVGGLLGPLEIDCARYERDLIVGAAQRRENRDVLARARALTEDLALREQVLRQLVARTVAAVTPAPNYAVPDVAALGPLPNTRRALDEYLSRLDQVGRAMQLVQDAYGQALAERDTTASLIEALRAKAAALGHSADRDLTALFDLTTSLLARSPAPMAVIRQLVLAGQAYLDVSASERSLP